VGVPVGGTAGQFLTKIDGTNYNTDWTTVNLSAYAVKANNLSDLTNFATARDNLSLGTLNTPVFNGVTAQGSGANVANLGATFLTLNHTGYGQFTIQPSTGITFPDATIQTTAYPGPVGATTWGSITGTLSNQTDLQTALDGKYSTTNPSGFQTAAQVSTALAPYLLSSTAASTYQTLAGMSDYLSKDGNLAGLASTSTARTNLGLGSLAVVNDAPSDGSQYARKNAAWEVVTSTSSYISSVSSPLSVTSGNLTIDLSSYLTTATAASTYYLQTNPSGFQTAGDVTTALSPYLLSSTAASTYAVIAAGQPTAGTTGQVLTKNSGTNYDSSWQTLIPGDRYLTSSTTSNTVSNGTKSFTIGTGLSYTPTQNITISYDASNHMHGEVLTYNSGTGALSVDVNHHTGSGTYTAWVVNVGGVTPATSVAWGAITGTLSAQTDLQSALDAKLAVTTAASTYQTLSGMSSYLTTSTAASTYATKASPTFTGLSTFNNPGNYAITLDNSVGNYTSISSGVYSIYASTVEVIRLSAGGIKYPDGVTQSVAYPGSSGFLLKADNLSGLANTATARTNLGLGTMAVETASNYLTTATAASTYQTLSGMSSYLTTATAASTYQTISGMSSYLTTASAASTYFTIASAANKADLASPTFTGVPAAPTAAPGTNTTQVATTAFVQSAVSAGAGAVWGSITGTLSSQTDLQSALDAKLSTSTAASTYAPLASPALTGNPTAPTPSTGDNDTSIATTAFVKAQGYLTSAPVTSVAGRTGAVTLSTSDISGLGTMATATASDYSTTTVANGLYYPLASNPAGYLTSAPVTSVAGRTGAVTLAVADVSGAAPLASPGLTGTPTAPTAAAATNTTQIATTEFVTTADNLKANLASPTFTGTPAAPTASAGTNTTQLATTAFVRTDNNVKAWVNFNGTGTVAIRASFNISSITDNGSSDYTVNMTNALADANYAVAACGDSASGFFIATASGQTAPTASLFRVRTYNAAVQGVDSARVLITVIR
jgi:hypothetical protein